VLTEASMEDARAVLMKWIEAFASRDSDRVAPSTGRSRFNAATGTRTSWYAQIGIPQEVGNKDAV